MRILAVLFLLLVSPCAHPQQVASAQTLTPQDARATLTVARAQATAASDLATANAPTATTPATSTPMPPTSTPVPTATATNAPTATQTPAPEPSATPQRSTRSTTQPCSGLAHRRRAGKNSCERCSSLFALTSMSALL